MVLIERPWVRVKQPTTIPEGLTRELVAAMPVEQLKQMLRDHLLPSGPSGPDRVVWDQFWWLLQGHDELAERACDVLEEFLDATEDALEVAAADDPQRKRMTKFQASCEQAWQRLQRDPAAQRTVPATTRRLAAAISRHQATVRGTRSVTAADEQLWSVLATVGSGPARPGSRR